MDLRKAKLKKLEEDLNIILLILDFHAKTNYEEKLEYIDDLLDQVNFLKQEIAKLRTILEDEESCFYPLFKLIKSFTVKQLNTFLEQVQASRTEEERQSLLEQERQRISGLNTENSIKELQVIALRVKDIKASVEALREETQLRASIVKMLNETTDLEVLEIYRQTLINLLRMQRTVNA